MSREKVKELLKKRSTKIGSIVLAAAIVFGGSMWAWKDSETVVPELVTYVDMEGDVVIEEEDPYYGNATVKTTTKTKKKTKKIKLKKPSTKTYTKKGKTKTKTNTKTKNTTKETVVTKVVEKTSVVNKFKKNSKIQTQVTTIKTTTTVTTTPKTLTTKTTTQSNTTKANTATVAAANTAMTAAAAAPNVDSRVKNAFDKMGCTIKTASGVNYDGYFDARSRTITLNAAKDTSETVYHELGHFLAFVAGNYDKSAEFQAIFSTEQANYTEYNKAYVCSSAAEYFAESFKNYTLNPAALRASRPQTCAAIEKCLAKVTDAQVNMIMTAYSAIWK